MKYKILLTGTNQVLLGEFFTHLDYSFECMGSTERPEDILCHLKYFHPDALVLAHPECIEDVLELADFIGSTSQIIDFVEQSKFNTFIICTEIGVFYELMQKNPDKKFYTVGHRQFCPNMKKVRVEGNEIFKHEYVGEINRGKYMLYTVWRGVDYALANQLNYLPECTEIVDNIHVFFDGITLDKLSNDTILCANICQYLLKEGILEDEGFITDCICGYSCTYEVPDMEKLKAIITKYKAMEGNK